ncbi:response regulator [Kineosporia succinea]|uniref:CheY-like chemotaxis protein n=1 Tax=Kineosporia succinea TaxID=84632 RepID=A0ABT9P2E7_9ACTN|nr:response regulator [Kineosporia succinea]MDP9826854.1 CheY-like chemotaxis protein [Kineosporia succinea]
MNAAQHQDWILLVDDSSEDRELLQHTLRRNKFRGRVEEARDGIEAIDRLCCRGTWAGEDPNDLPRAVFLDVKMPRLSGVEVLRELRSTPHLAAVPVVMLTSSAEERDILACYSLGANSYVVKPVDMDEYFRSIADVGRYWVALNRTPTEYPRANTTAPAGR